MKQIEDCLFETIHPVNSIPVLNRLEELLKENKTNNLNSCLYTDRRVQKCFLLLVIQTTRDIKPLNYLDWYKQLEAEEPED